ncbi:MAG: FAD-dependent oxidoreductase [Pseudomonadales bacterium]|nr:FAD-dependent oxidoreductase [Pseudomonadales bacterium]
MTALNHLFQPTRIGSLELKNRIVMAPMTVDYANDDETPSERHIAYYAERAKGGVGLITMEVCTIDAEHRYQAHSLGLYADHLIEPHKKLVDAVHAHGAKIFPQISHTGPESLSPFYRGIPPVGPSVVRTQTTLQVCRELALEEIPKYVAMYGDACLRAQKAGYDGVELHAAHSYMLLGSFLSPLRNHRTDAYSGRKLEGRMKFLLEVLADIRSKCGPDFPIVLRLSGFERESGGREINDTQRMAPHLVAAGVNAFHISGGVGDNNITQIIAGSEYRSGYNAAMAAALRQVVDVPVMVVGRNGSPQFAEQLLRDEKADLVVIGRALFTDPELPNKARAGKLAEIRPCNSCEDCVDSIGKGSGSACAINPRSGRETELVFTPPATKKNILVIGGGPAGMEAARIAAEQGHRVTLCEKSSQLGGLLALAANMHRDQQNFLDYLRSEVQRLPIDVQLNTTVTADFVCGQQPDAVIVATGGIVAPTALAIDSSATVIQGDALQQLLAANTPQNIPGNTIAVTGSGLLSLEIAEWLALAGKTVKLIAEDHRFATEVGKKRRGEECKRLDAADVIVTTGARIDRIAADGVHITLDGQQRLIKADSVVIPPALQADNSLVDMLHGCGPTILAIGDCTGLGLLKKAMSDAMNAIWVLDNSND